MEHFSEGGATSVSSHEHAKMDLRSVLLQALEPFRIGELGMSTGEAVGLRTDPSEALSFEEDACHEGDHVCEVGGFEEHLGISNQDVARVVHASFPRSWISHGGLRSLRIEPHEESSFRVQRKDSGVHIVIHHGGYSVSDLFRLIVRATVSSSDWRSPFYDERVRRELARLMHARVSSPDHTPFVSVSSLPFQDTDARARRYWVELFTSALSIDASDEREWERGLSHRLRAYRMADARRDTFSGVRLDIATIRRVCALIDPSFVLWRAARNRLHFLHRAVRVSHAHEAESCLHELPDDLRSSFALGVDRVLHGPGVRVTPSTASSDLVSSFPSDLGYGFDAADRIHHALADLAWLDGELPIPSRHPSIDVLRRACQDLTSVTSHHAPDVRRRFAEAIAMRDPQASARHLI